MEKPKVSICISVYNTGIYLNRCLDSIINQDFDEIEIIVVNDGSPDNAYEILEEYAQKDERIVVINKTENKGLMCARKDAYTRAKGDYLMFVDSDDYLEPYAIEKLYDKITAEKADIVVSGYNYYSAKRRIAGYLPELKYGESKEGVYKALLLNELPHNLWAKMYDSRLFRDYEYTCLLNQTNGEDLILFYEVIGNVKKVTALGEPTYAYCRNFSSATHVKFSDEKFIKRLEATFIWYNQMKSFSSFRDMVEKKVIDHFLYMYIIGCSNKIIKPFIDEHPSLFAGKQVVNKLGKIKGMLFELYRRGVISGDWSFKMILLKRRITRVLCGLS